MTRDHVEVVRLTADLQQVRDSMRGRDPDLLPRHARVCRCQRCRPLTLRSTTSQSPTSNAMKTRRRQSQKPTPGSRRGLCRLLTGSSSLGGADHYGTNAPRHTAADWSTVVSEVKK
jgi:hypothetical protein